MTKVMTVKDLKKILDKLPEEATVNMLIDKVHSGLRAPVEDAIISDNEITLLYEEKEL